MSEKSSRSKKKSKDYSSDSSSDDDIEAYVNREMSRAMKQVCYYTPALKKWGVYWFTSVRGSVHSSVLP